MVERLVYTEKAGGSIPPSPTMDSSQIQIVYEDDDILVIDKPAGLLTHRVSKINDSSTVVSWLLKYYPDVKNVYNHLGEDPEWEAMRPGIVHRLDKETSGLIVIAKNQNSFDFLKNIFKTRDIKKMYITLVYGHLKEKSGIINAPIGKYGGRQTTRTVVGRRYLKEKEAVTEYKVLKEYRDFSLLEVRPHTGRTHQIRVHLKSIGHPIVCDLLYRTKKMTCPAELGRLFLHAKSLRFDTLSGRALNIELDLPQELTNFLVGLDNSQ